MYITSARTELWAIQMLCPQAQVGACCNNTLKQAMRHSKVIITFYETNQDTNDIT
jgi:hypothetical protein